jgi:CheY-like chemotaxis protein
VYLPLAKSRHIEYPSQDAEPLPTGSGHILVVDDEPPIVQIQQQILESLGYRVTVRTSSLEALEAFRADPGRFDLILTDMTMPQMTGDRLARAVKAIRPALPVILCTGFSEKLGEHEKSPEIEGVLMKPVDKKQMAEMVARVRSEFGSS